MATSKPNNDLLNDLATCRADKELQKQRILLLRLLKRPTKEKMSKSAGRKKFFNLKRYNEEQVTRNWRKTLSGSQHLLSLNREVS